LEYRIILRHHWRWFPVGCEILGPNFKASAEYGYCNVLKHQCVVIDCEALDSGKQWQVKGTSSRHRIKATPEEFKRADVGMDTDLERARLRKLHKI
jgi:hypothetical protein